MKTITNTTSVGIYNNCEQVARIYDDRTVATLPYVKWVGSTGGYAERKIKITGQAHEEILAALDDDAESTAWDIITAYDSNEYRPNPAGRPLEMLNGRARTLYLDDESFAVAKTLGNGSASEGIRAALKIAAARDA